MNQHNISIFIACHSIVTKPSRCQFNDPIMTIAAKSWIHLLQALGKLNQITPK